MGTRYDREIPPPARRIEIGPRRRHPEPSKGGVLVQPDAFIRGGVEIRIVVEPALFSGTDEIPTGGMQVQFHR